MNNEPVAWMDKESNIAMIGGIYPKKLKEYLSNLEARIVALEAHPVKELTDFEILQTSECYPDRLHFARAILRKAQEK